MPDTSYTSDEPVWLMRARGYLRRAVRRALREPAALAAFVAAAMGPTAVHAWSHGLATRTYFMPGGPEETFLTGCIVTTTLGKDPAGDLADLAVYNGDYNGLNTNCNVLSASNWIQIVTYDGTRLNNGPLRRTADLSVYRNGSYTLSWNVSKGAYGQAVFGAHVSAINTGGLVRQWQILVN